MKGILTRARQVTLPEAAKKVLLIVSSLLIFDVFVSVLGASYARALSDLLFLEGAIIFAFGTFIAVARAWQGPKPSPEPTTKTNDNSELTPDKRMHPSILMMIVGAILMGLSIMVAKLLL